MMNVFPSSDPCLAAVTGTGRLAISRPSSSRGVGRDYVSQHTELVCRVGSERKIIDIEDD